MFSYLKIPFILILLLTGDMYSQNKKPLHYFIQSTNPEEKTEKSYTDVEFQFSDSLLSEKSPGSTTEDQYLQAEQNYTINKGDCLWKIAFRITNNPLNWKKIYGLNNTIIKNPNLIYPGQRIKIYSYEKKTEPDTIISKSVLALSIPEKTEAGRNIIKDSIAADNPEMGNFIVDETLSKIGKDYYDLFYLKWESQLSGSMNYSIIISEKPLPQRGTHISIRINDLDVYQSFVQPRYEFIEQSVDEGIYMVYNYLKNYESVQKELEQGDMKGTGIY